MSSECSKDDVDAIVAVDLPAIAKAQTHMIFENSTSSYKKYDIGIEQKLLCEDSQTNPRPVIPLSLQKAVFSTLHDMAHPG